MLIVDAHLDLSWNALQWGRDLKRSVYTIRTQENTTPGKGRGLGTVAFPEMRQGRVALCVRHACWRARPATRSPHIDYATPAQSYGIAHGPAGLLSRAGAQGHVRIIADAGGLDPAYRRVGAWEAGGARCRSPPPLGLVISMEGADPILAPDQLAGVVGRRPAAAGHDPLWAGALRRRHRHRAGPDRAGAAAAGRDGAPGHDARPDPLLRPGFWQALEHYGGPVLASHHNCRALVPHQRQFSDDQIRAIVERDGVIGAALDTWMLEPGWAHRRAPQPGQPSRHAERCRRPYRPRLPARRQQPPRRHRHRPGRRLRPRAVAARPRHHRRPAKAAGLLAARGYAEADIAAIMHGNWLRLLRRVWQRLEQRTKSSSVHDSTQLPNSLRVSRAALINRDDVWDEPLSNSLRSARR